jgi:hypothetical protein
MSTPDSPKTFISYSWTDTKHEEWVLDLARDLREFGADVIIDKWDLEEGQDMYAFMEQMVTDPDMDKVLIICDEEYARKADEREGGVGTETQIVSKDLYDAVDPDDPQKKFAAVITETDENGKPYLPTYMKNRIYFDMSTPEAREGHFERLVRWLFGKPQEEKPPLGKPPAYLLEEEGRSLGTSSRALQVKRKLRNGNTAAVGAVRDYFETFARNLDVFDIASETNRLSHEPIVEAIDDFLPYRNEAADVFVTLATYWPGADALEALHGFFEDLLPYTLGTHPRDPHDTSSDHFKFIIYELFLYAVATLLKQRRFKGVDHLLSNGYYLSEKDAGLRHDAGLRPFVEFRPYLQSVEDHWDHNRTSKTSDFLDARADRDDIRLEDIMQAELILYLRNEVERARTEDQWRGFWHPNSLLHASDRRSPFELFARAAGDKSFGGLDTVLNLQSQDELCALIQELSQSDQLPKFSRRTILVHQMHQWTGIERP